MFLRILLEMRGDLAGTVVALVLQMGLHTGGDCGRCRRIDECPVLKGTP